jgi:hypothetical protein
VPHSGDEKALRGHKLRQSAGRIGELAAKQFGVVGLAQLLALGLSHKQVRALVACGFLHPLFRGAFAVGHRNIGQWGWLMAAFLAGGPESFLCHRTSAAAMGLRGIYTKQIELTIQSSGGFRSQDGLIIHRTAKPPHPADLTTRKGIPISSLPRMFIEVAPTASTDELDHFITMAARKQILDITAVEEAFVRHARRPGVKIVKEAFAAYRPRPDRQSDFEREFDEELEQRPEIPQPTHRNIRLFGWEVDCYWQHHGLVVELDGRPYHVAVRDAEKDKFKDGKLLLKRIQTFRITDLRWQFDRKGAMDDLQQLLSLQPLRAGS